MAFPMESFAQMTCKLKVNFHCEGCKRKVLEVLQNLKGVYSLAIDADRGEVKVNGKVNPIIILGVLDKYAKHGEVTDFRIDGEAREERPYFPYAERGPYAPKFYHPHGEHFYGSNPYYVDHGYSPYEVLYPPYQSFGGPDILYGGSLYLMPPPRGPLPPPPRPALPPANRAPPAPVAKPKALPMAPSPQCCIM